jgi:plasmid maintenance system antidote protein VapI
VSEVFWGRGDQTAIANEVGVDPRHINDVLHRRKGVSPEFAERLAAATFRATGKEVPMWCWLWNRVTNHKAFYTVEKNLEDD